MFYNWLFAFVVYSFVLVGYWVVGLAAMPRLFAVNAKGSMRTSAFLFAPILGMAINTVLISIVSLTIGYNTVTCIGVYLFMLVVVIVKRKNLYIVKGKAFWIFIAIAFIISTNAFQVIQPIVIDGGMYFVPSAYDHARIAIVDSIVNKGFPIYSPWVANDGQLIEIGYHFGMQVLAAQITTVYGINSMFSAMALMGAVNFLVMLGLAGMVVHFLPDKRAYYFVIPIFLMSNLEIGPLKKVTEYFADIPGLFGFWPCENNLMWGPHHSIAGIMCLCILWFVMEIMATKERKAIIGIAFDIAVLSAGASLCSIYSGFMALLLLAVSFGVMCIFDKEFRKAVNERLICFIQIAIIVFIFNMPYGLYLKSHTTGTKMIGFGLLPHLTTHTDGILNILLSIPVVFLIMFPIRIGLQYILGSVGLFIPGLVKKGKDITLARINTIVGLVVIFIFHSMIYSNDFSWRSGYVAFLLQMCFGAILLYRIFDKLWNTKKSLTVAYIAIIVGAVAVCFQPIALDFKPMNTGSNEMHKEYLGVCEGWEVIHANTDMDDLVLCNPDNYAEMNPAMGDATPNYHFSFFARRYSPMGDYSYAKTSGILMGIDKIEKLHDDIIDLFAGNPSQAKVDYFADVQKVKAILVTPRDGLYYDEGVLRTRYPGYIEGENYKAYFTSPVK